MTDKFPRIEDLSSSLIFIPSNKISPESILFKALIKLKIVVFPAPDGPTNPTISFAFTFKFKFFKIWN